MSDWKSIAQHLEPSVQEEISVYDSREQLEARLAAIIYEMLDNRFEQLAQLMYRLDVPEARFNEALSAPTLQQTAHAISTLMVDREIIRQETRKRFS